MLDIRTDQWVNRLSITTKPGHIAHWGRPPAPQAGVPGIIQNQPSLMQLLTTLIICVLIGWCYDRQTLTVSGTKLTEVQGGTKYQGRQCALIVLIIHKKCI